MNRSEAERYALEQLIKQVKAVKRRVDQQLDCDDALEKAERWANIRNGLSGYG